MRRVVKIVLPDNGRLEDFDPNGSEEALGRFVPLPIEMPKVLRIWTGQDGKPVAVWADRLRIRPEDFATVLRGIDQYNADYAKA